ncbi:NAD-dependent epimerase/dehydratase family protein [Paracidobacterium acidisoli]|uniref:NAD-dependent epimerase/dehydratase family protein n=1 Tax=Paracidobacterium acidisoli TaxID=2303751 RepID=A0A372IUU7_9BACT|nr:NAD-dependent epimerase/dehydratase family protein [Paracidobacterium acidisoli]MBT9329482.1 NAD-dependent epimerase/dehydratase family protein [Paracidobacterium acidisoli]
MSNQTEETIRAKKWFLAGGAGFIGSHFTDHLLGTYLARSVTLYDNFSSGREWHYEAHAGDLRLSVVRGGVDDLETLTEAMRGHDVVLHLASNPDIARAALEPQIDFQQGTQLTSNIVEAMRRSSVRRLLYASGSGVYGDLGSNAAYEDHGPLVPVSTYGASKLGGEALIAGYCAMFGLTACAFRFANVIGARQTHGVGLDFIRRLGRNPQSLTILGDGQQSKHYIHASDVVKAVLCAAERSHEGFSVFNIATDDAITVNEIAALAAQCLALPSMPALHYTGGSQGWKGDVPIVRLNADRIRSLGWIPHMNSHQAMRRSLEELISDDRTRFH